MTDWKRSRAWIDLNMDNLRKNIKFFRRIISDDCLLMPAVKANAYGHGVFPVVQVLREEGISNFCVASVSEGIELRNHGVQGEILILGYTAAELFTELEHYDLTQTVVDASYAEILARSGRKLKVHVGVDTGMHRLGEDWNHTGGIAGVWEHGNLSVTGVFSHLCASDGISSEETAFTREQIRRFDEIVRKLRHRGISGFQTHLQGSYGILNYPECNYSCVRPGIALYGVLSKEEDLTRIPFMAKPVLSLKTRVELVKELNAGERAGYGLAFTAGKQSRIAVLSIGYADGIPRELSGKGYVLIHGEKAPIVGRICMDQMFVDITGLKCAEHVKMHDEAVLIGNSGEQTITAERFAAFTGTISNEVLSRLGERLERCCV